MIKQQKKLPKRKKKYIACKSFFSHFFWPMGLGETLANFFSFIFPVSWILREKINSQIFFGDFHFDILLIVLMICLKKYLSFFLGDRSWFWILEFWFWGFGSWSFDFGGLDLGVLILGVWILEFWGFGSWSFGGLDLGVLILGVWILEFWFWGFGSWSFDFGGLDLGVLILGVWILEFWFWGFGSWSFDFGGTVCTHLMFQKMRLSHFRPLVLNPQGGVAGPLHFGSIFEFSGPCEVVEGIKVLAKSVVFLRFVDLVASTRSKVAKAHIKNTSNTSNVPTMSILKALVFSWAAEVRCCRHGLMLPIDCVGPRNLSVVSGLLVMVHGSCCWRTGS